MRKVFLIVVCIWSVWLSGVALAEDNDGSTSTIGQTFKSKAITYRVISDTEVSIVRWLNDNGYWEWEYPLIDDVIEYNGKRYSVVAVEKGAFLLSGSLISEVFLPRSIREIGDNVFDGDNSRKIRSIGMGNAITEIKEKTFYCASGVTEIYLSNNIKTIGDYAFQSCASLEEIVLPATLETVGKSPFGGCSKLGNVTVLAPNPPELSSDLGVVPSVVYVPEKSLELYQNDPQWQTYNLMPIESGQYDTDDVEAETPETINTSDEYYFEKDEFLYHIISDSEVTIAAWLGSEIYEPEINETVDYDGKSYLLTGIEYRAFADTDVRKIHMPNSIRYIGEGAFMDSELEEIVISESVKEIKSDVFKRCSDNLKTIKIPEGVTKIGDEVFWSVKYLNYIDFPSTLKSIGYLVFNYVKGGNSGFHRDLIIRATTPPAVDKLFGFDFRTPFLQEATKLYVPRESVELYRNTPAYSSFKYILPLEEANVGKVENIQRPNGDVYDISGRVVLRNASEEDIQRLSPGIYITGGKKIYVK